RIFFSSILFHILYFSTACGIKCYSCGPTDPKSCTTTLSCSDPFNRCFSLDVNGVTTKGCQSNAFCVKPMDCCEGDLCNSAIPTGPSVILLLVSSAIITLFL
uniref:UPAR/Ly6 domain-containing protein n=1 Tax=Lates calcarifer TaxID=8187 RepID=A0A4W6CA50_LATCA